ncbi:MAG: CBS domain-containing protein [Thermoanaerobaculia bacterium]
MKNSDSFLNAFTRIEKHLRHVSNAKPWIPFTQLVSRASRDFPEVRRFREDLKEFADLRNAIVHDRMHDQVIAEPNAWAVERIAMIADLLTKPPAVVPHFAKKVFTVTPERTLADAVKLMKKHEFSKLPVVSGRNFGGVLTANAITRWLGANAEGGPVDLHAATVADVLKFAEDGGSILFVTPETTVFEVFEAFHKVESRGKTLEAVLITEHGQPSDRILGLITVTDLPRILPLVEGRETPTPAGAVPAEES